MSSENGADDSIHHLDPTEDSILQDHTPPEGSSDGEGGERTAREKLKKTSIAGLAQYSGGKTGGSAEHPLSESTNVESLPEPSSENGLRGRPSKKRSFEDLQNEESAAGVENGGPPLPKKGQHKRMRSREISSNDHIQGFDKLEDLASPVQEESDAEAQQSPGGPGVLVEAPPKERIEESITFKDEKDTAAESAIDKPESASAVPVNTERSSVADSSSTLASSAERPPSHNPLSSGFANTSAASPFSSFKSPKPSAIEPDNTSSSDKSTSTSAFASSGLSAFASSEKSPFGTVGATANASGGFGGAAGQNSGFGSRSGGFGAASPFAVKSTSGFSSAGGFGSGSGFAGGLGGATRPFGMRGVSPFGGPATGAVAFGKPKPFKTSKGGEEEGSENGDEGGDAPQPEEDAKQDPRFKEQEGRFYSRM